MLKTKFISLTKYHPGYVVIDENHNIKETLWYTLSFVNLLGEDPFVNKRMNWGKVGGCFAGHILYKVHPVDSIPIDVESNRIPYTYSIKERNGEKRIYFNSDSGTLYYRYSDRV